MAGKAAPGPGNGEERGRFPRQHGQADQRPQQRSQRPHPALGIRLRKDHSPGLQGPLPNGDQRVPADAAEGAARPAGAVDRGAQGGGGGEVGPAVHAERAAAAARPSWPHLPRGADEAGDRDRIAALHGGDRAPVPLQGRGDQLFARSAAAFRRRQRHLPPLPQRPDRGGAARRQPALETGLLLLGRGVPPDQRRHRRQRGRHDAPGRGAAKGGRAGGCLLCPYLQAGPGRKPPAPAAGRRKGTGAEGGLLAQAGVGRAVPAQDPGAGVAGRPAGDLAGRLPADLRRCGAGRPAACLGKRRRARRDAPLGRTGGRPPGAHCGRRAGPELPLPGALFCRGRGERPADRQPGPGRQGDPSRPPARPPCADPGA